MENIIEFKDVTYNYDTDDGNETVFENLSFSIKKGSFTAILGKNGSGKSTISRLSNGMIRPTSGKVFVSGMDTSEERHIKEIRRTVGLVFQNPDNQIVATVVEDDVAFGPENLGVPPEIIRKRVDNALKAVDMYEYRSYQPHKLSGGQKQRVAIAGVIAMEPECIFFDEPTAMLDPKGRLEVIDTAKKLNREKGITVIFITHHMEEVIDADRIIVLNDGEISMDGTPSEIFGNVEGIKKAGLNVPQPAELLYELKREGIDLNVSALSVEDCAKALTAYLGGEEK